MPREQQGNLIDLIHEVFLSSGQITFLHERYKLDMLKNLTCLLVLIFTLTSARSQTPAKLFSRDSLKKHIHVLASDEFLGRKPFSVGETKTISYIRN